MSFYDEMYCNKWVGYNSYCKIYGKTTRDWLYLGMCVHALSLVLIQLSIHCHAKIIILRCVVLFPGSTVSTLSRCKRLKLQHQLEVLLKPKKTSVMGCFWRITDCENTLYVCLVDVVLPMYALYLVVIYYARHLKFEQVESRRGGKKEEKRNEYMRTKR